MAAITTFLVGTVVGGGVKWAYDKWQDKEEKPDLSVAAVREKSAATARNFGQSVSNVVRRRKSESTTSTTDSGSAPTTGDGAEAASS